MTHFIGVDVSKKTLDVVVIKGGEILKQAKLANEKKSIRHFFKELKKEITDFHYPTTVICLEHTGIYAYILLNFLVNAKANICLEPGLQIKQSQGMQRGKNDKIDAKRIALYAYKNQQELRFWKPARPVVQKLQALLTLRERLIRVRTKLQIPLQEGMNFIDASIQKMIKLNSASSLKAIGKDIDKVEKEIQQLIDQDEILKRQFDIITSVPGVGRITASSIIVSTHEFKRITEAKKFACYAGVAPFEHTSGTSVRGKTRVSHMANMNIKRLLHLAALSASQHCSELSTYYNRKVSEGKSRLSVNNAVRNKLITRIFACIRDQRHYEKEYKNVLG
jgi:transposase